MIVVCVGMCRDYWHQTLNLETPSISISSSLVDIDSYPFVQDALEKELKGETRTLVPASEALKAAMRTKCFPAWNISFGSHTHVTIPVSGSGPTTGLGAVVHELDMSTSRGNVEGEEEEVRVQHDGGVE
jgi:hypothetical protein